MAGSCRIYEHAQRAPTLLFTPVAMLPVVVFLHILYSIVQTFVCNLILARLARVEFAVH